MGDNEERLEKTENEDTPMIHKKITKPIVCILLILVVAAAGYAGAAFAISQQTGAVPGVMSYQGYLTNNGGVPLTGTPDFQFALYEASSGGTALWSENQNDVPVTNGYFSVMLGSVTPLQASLFDGSQRYLEVRVDTGSGLTTLPRQLLGSVPFAFQAEQAQAVPWSGITSRPPGLDDGDNDTQYTAGDGLVLNSLQFSAQGTPYQHVVIVAKQGGDYTSITDALNNINADGNNRYLVWIAPGNYQENVVMEPWVDLMGAGELLTTIWNNGSNDSNVAVVKGADNAMLSHLTIQCSGGQFTKAMLNSNASPELLHVTLIAGNTTSIAMGIHNTGATASEGSYPDLEAVTLRLIQSSPLSGTLYGLYNSNMSYPALHNVSFYLNNGSEGYAIYNVDQGGVEVSDASLVVSNFSDAYGIQTAGEVSDLNNVRMEIQGVDNAAGILVTSSNVEIRNVQIDVEADNATGISSVATEEWYDSIVRVNANHPSGTAKGIINNEGNIILNNFNVVVRGSDAVALYNINGSAKVNLSRLETNASNSNIGIQNSVLPSGTGFTVSVLNSLIRGATNTLNTVAGYTSQIGDSHLNGGAISGPSVTCAGVYDESFDFYPNTCPYP